MSRDKLLTPKVQKYRVLNLHYSLDFIRPKTKIINYVGHDKKPISYLPNMVKLKRFVKIKIKF